MLPEGSKQQPRAAESNQEQPRAATSSQEQPGAAKSSPEQRESAKSSQGAAQSSQKLSGPLREPKTLIFHSFYKENVISSIKMLPKPLVLQHFQKKSCCGLRTVVCATTALQPQQLYFRNCCRTNGFSNFFRQRRGDEARQTFTSPLVRENPYSSCLLCLGKI